MKEGIVVVNDTTFTWYLNLSGKDDSEVMAICEDRKNKAVVSITDSGEEKDFFSLSDLREVADDFSSGKNAATTDYQHRQLSTMNSN